MFFKRFIADVIDGLLVCIVLQIAISSVIAAVTYIFGISENLLFNASWKENMYETMVYISFILLLTLRDFKGISLGRLVFKFKIVDNTTFENPSFSKSFVRALIFIVFPIDNVIMLTNLKRNTIADLITKTHAEVVLECGKSY